MQLTIEVFLLQHEASHERKVALALRIPTQATLAHVAACILLALVFLLLHTFL